LADSATVTNEKSLVRAHKKAQRKKDFFILQQLVTKDFKLRYRRSVLGVIWSVLNPLLMMIIMSFVFSYFLKSGDIQNYPLYLIVGNITFMLMSDATNGGLGSIIGASSLLKKVKIDRWVFPVQKVFSAAVNFAFSLIAVAIVMLFFRIPPTIHMLWMFVALLLLMVFCIGISLLIGALAVFFRDMIHLWSVLLTAWTYLTPRSCAAPLSTRPTPPVCACCSPPCGPSSPSSRASRSSRRPSTSSSSTSRKRAAPWHTSLCPRPPTRSTPSRSTTSL